jgi:hypothetical protein
MNTFIEHSNLFDPHMKQGSERFHTFKIAMNYYLQYNGKVIVETGTQRQLNDWGAGCSTSLIGKFISEFSPTSRLYSVDISSLNIQISKEICCQDYRSHITWLTEDSIGFLKNFNEKIDFLYLDSYDWFPQEPGLTECQKHQLSEMEACLDKMNEKSVILLDDNDLPDGGKSKLTKEFLTNNNWICLLDSKQSIWIRK